ncbi:cytochrome c maturation protein CcmE [Oceanicella actignis]|uniref:Cytochrome c-type biogenesis protein CcmE n=1 Tax=Oceanicella actignis TaxID=1189325 RepID=A0A1M7S2I5_9RHOB|nr:cytochrome c maturation protein CcmE [Oceanicella actignis]TYO90182.1 cytochrome c-type biogenesis protein CcmE [Oceanicella actignis]SES90168.1 cytochrome c-type biogenesis protein CcmE [Oceanicella actignis]SHN52723.1 cytochrome c-type biogenesis protein CcmE [Oceanicella actignis]
MAMTRKKRRIALIAAGMAALAAAATLVGVGMRDSIVFFFSPAEMIARAPGPDQRLRVGGLVEVGSVERGQGETVSFVVTDGAASLPVRFKGVLPDLFSEGQGVVAEGRLVNGVFVADEVLAKHDETYMPREVADALKKQGVYRGAEEGGGS